MPFSFLVGAAKMLLAFDCWILDNHDVEIFWEYIATVKTLLISGSYTRMESLPFFKDTSPAVSTILGTLAFYFVGLHPNLTSLRRIITEYCCSLMLHSKGCQIKRESPIFIQSTIWKGADVK